jgi:hypothetical protein
MGMDASMSKGTQHRLEALYQSGLPKEIPADAQLKYQDVITLILKNMEEH